MMLQIQRVKPEVRRYKTKRFKFVGIKPEIRRYKFDFIYDNDKTSLSKVYLEFALAKNAAFFVWGCENGIWK